MDPDIGTTAGVAVVKEPHSFAGGRTSECKASVPCESVCGARRIHLSVPVIVVSDATAIYRLWDEE